MTVSLTRLYRYDFHHYSYDFHDYSRCPRLHIHWVRQVHDFQIMHRSPVTPGMIWCQIVAAVMTNTKEFYSLKLWYWLPHHCLAFLDRTDFYDISTMLLRLHEQTMSFSTIFRIVAIGTTKAVQCGLGFIFVYNKAKRSTSFIKWKKIGALDPFEYIFE